MSRQRLDDLLVGLGQYGTRARARDAILRGCIRVNGLPAEKPGQLSAEDAIIEIFDPAKAYVSRAALKLIHALDHFKLSPEGCFAVDIGASTGGFTQVLVERGARHVVALDVGHGQFDVVLARDHRITLIEKLNARQIDVTHLAEAPQFIVCDVSFISLTLALPPALSLAASGSHLVALIKPQFESGRGALGKRGVVSDPDIHNAICLKIAGWIGDQGWRVIGLTPSPVEGGNGNSEFLIAAEKIC